MAQRVLVHISRSEQRVVDPDDVYCLVATGGETEVRLRGRTPLIILDGSGTECIVETEVASLKLVACT
jgi:hypothetical protein